MTIQGNANTPRKLLAVFAHPDDETFICGGTFAKYAAEGVEMTLVSATRGEMGRRMGNPPYLNRETMAAAREQELREACACLGIGNLIFFDIRDKTVEFEDERSLEGRIEALIRDIAPDVVLTFHERYGGHPDHCAIGKATTAAFWRSARKGALYFITFGDAMERPERYGYKRKDVVKIDVQAYQSAKLAAFRAHRCQTEIDEWVWLADNEALSRFGRHEYFLKGDVQAAQRANTDLF
ncbi:PIG-L family deacetylase [Paenibacillus sacheonensis]|uniref:LmbE family protein n=1 Tax=Paenibacillus sacheonensis TaxID=742054 RepID=A0A7X4YTY8_9BACL|nr:PIG-L family deacetylase [Paenibacillus sacheonensis]MBM7568615.1 bacillithiol biosynthesis deacetylase BshB2 [Paenibacillus sacheonensis]NBC72490.1 LmbE family protein [Paenibacillus sacheonensis]